MNLGWPKNCLLKINKKFANAINLATRLKMHTCNTMYNKFVQLYIDNEMNLGYTYTGLHVHVCMYIDKE